MNNQMNKKKTVVAFVALLTSALAGQAHGQEIEYKSNADDLTKIRGVLEEFREDIIHKDATRTYIALLDELRQIRHGQRLRPAGVAEVQRGRGQFPITDSPRADAGNNVRRQPQMCILGSAARGAVARCSEIIASARAQARGRKLFSFDSTFFRYRKMRANKLASNYFLAQDVHLKQVP
jgi:hypothetical protein